MCGVAHQGGADWSVQIGHSLDQQLIQLPEPLPTGRRDRVVRVAHGWSLAGACESLMFMPMALSGLGNGAS
jgi:hypothetical protein